MSIFCYYVISSDFKSVFERRVKFDITFIYKVLNSGIDALDLLSEISLVTFPYYLRNLQLSKLNFISLITSTQPLWIVLVAQLIIC